MVFRYQKHSWFIQKRRSSLMTGYPYRAQNTEMNSFRLEPKHGLFRNVTPLSMTKNENTEILSQKKISQPIQKLGT